MILAIALFVLLSITTFDNHFGIFKLFYSHCYITFEVSADSRNIRGALIGFHLTFLHRK